MASSADKADALILADIEANGSSTPLEIARRLDRTSSSSVWRSCLRMANAGQITFDSTGRIASLTAPTTISTTPPTQEPTT